MPSVDADSDLDSAMVRARLYAGELLAARGVYGIVWLDEELVVTSRYGSITDFIEVGAPLTDSVLPVMGLEDEIKALSRSNEGILRLPNVSMITGQGPGPRLTMLLYAFNKAVPYMMIVAAAAAHSNLEMELSRQVRARLMAEAEAYAKSEELARTNAELTAANGNLEQFAAIVSHDLQAPMRALRYMADDIEAAVAAADGETARAKLAELRRQARRLSSMLSTLLHYSSAGLKREAIETVDTLALVNEIVHSLPHNGITVEIGGDWPELATLAAPLDLALRNLIDNTIKHHDRIQGHLSVSCQDAGDALEFTVADDGPGIEVEHQQSVFLPFRTLSGSGAGMGLAIVQKMVGAVGGAVTLTSNAAERRGTTFKIRWPKRIAL
jgi:signal transduction histidine kinase